MGKVNKKGRAKHEQFIRLHRGVTDSVAWKNLSCEAIALLLFIWTRHNGFNNGEISCSHRDARNALRIGNDRVSRAFRELQDKGFLVCRFKGHFDIKVMAGHGRASEWEITAEAYDANLPSRLYRKWQKN